MKVITNTMIPILIFHKAKSRYNNKIIVIVTEVKVFRVIFKIMVIMKM